MKNILLIQYDINIITSTEFLFFHWPVDCMLGGSEKDVSLYKVKKMGDRMKKKLLVGLVTMLFLAGMAGFWGSTAFAGTIMVVGDSNIGASSNTTFFSNVFGGSNVVTNSTDWSVTNFQGAVSGVATSYITDAGLVTSSTLNGMDWFIATGAESFDATEIDALTDFLDNDGSIWVVGEGVAYSTINNGSNNLLSALGSSLRIAPDYLSGSISISADPFTAGVTTFSYAYASGVTGGTELISIGGTAVAAYESTAPNPVPEPATMLLFGTGLAGLAGLRKRQGKK